MSDPNDYGPPPADGGGGSGFWDRLARELTGPWDWVAAGVGALGGLGVSAAVLHGDAGTSVGAGAMAAVTARKAAVASFKGRLLRNRAKALVEIIRRTHPHDRIIGDINRDLDLFRGKIITVQQFEKILDGYTERYRRMAPTGPY